MLRLVAGALLTTAALAVPAEAGPGRPFRVEVRNHSSQIGVFVWYDLNGGGEDPLGGAWYEPHSGRVCVGFSHQIPQCVGGPIE